MADRAVLAGIKSSNNVIGYMIAVGNELQILNYADAAKLFPDRAKLSMCTDVEFRKEHLNLVRTRDKVISCAVNIRALDRQSNSGNVILFCDSTWIGLICNAIGEHRVERTGLLTLNMFTVVNKETACISVSTSLTILEDIFVHLEKLGFKILANTNPLSYENIETEAVRVASMMYCYKQYSRQCNMDCDTTLEGTINSLQLLKKIVTKHHKKACGVLGINV